MNCAQVVYDKRIASTLSAAKKAPKAVNKIPNKVKSISPFAA